MHSERKETVFKAQYLLEEKIDLLTSKKWDLQELSNLIGFETSYRKKGKSIIKYDFPPKIEFNKLSNVFIHDWHMSKDDDKLGNKLKEHTLIRSIIGLKRTPIDFEFERIHNHWYWGARGEQKPTNNVTGFTILEYDVELNEFAMVCLQSTIAQKEFSKKYLEDLKQKGFKGDKRYAELSENKSPWSYNRRLYILAATAYWMAGQMNANWFGIYKKDLKRRYSTYREALSYIKNHISPKTPEIRILK